jgi:hypothetical protein
VRLDRRGNRVGPNTLEAEAVQEAQAEENEWDESDERPEGDGRRVRPEVVLAERLD